MITETTPINFFELKGRVIVGCEYILHRGTFYEWIGGLLFTLQDGSRLKIDHERECCESVSLVATFGDISNIIGSPVTLAEDHHPSDPEWHSKPYGDSHTWSVFVIETLNGRVEFWFLGESNGYYGETLEVNLIK